MSELHRRSTSQSRSPPSHQSLQKHDLSLTPARNRSRSRSYSDNSYSSCSRSPGYHTRKIIYRPERYHSEDDRSRSRSKERSSRIKYRSRSKSSRCYTRSRSRSYSSRSRTSSPRSSSRKHPRGYQAPQPGRYLGIFGLNKETTDDHLYQIFAKFGPINSCQIVKDRKTGESRGFAFINYENFDDAKIAKESSTGVEVDGHKLRVDYSFTQRAHTPTPGVYMGKTSKTSKREPRNSRDRDRYSRDHRRRRSSSSRHRRRHSRSRSRSYSPKYR